MYNFDARLFRSVAGQYVLIEICKSKLNEYNFEQTIFSSPYVYSCVTF